jgi:small-conductance mechanosensitive channel
MRATDFEYRHPTLVHQLIVGAAFLTYLFQADDIVWWLVREHPSPHALERVLFILATLLIGAGAGLCTRVRMSPSENHRRFSLGEFLYAIGLGSLAPVSGFFILLVGEGVRILRLMKRDQGIETVSSGTTAIRREAVKWCVLLSMVIFVITLRDRVVEILLVASFVVGLALTPVKSAVRSGQ